MTASFQSPLIFRRWGSGPRVVFAFAGFEASLIESYAAGWRYIMRLPSAARMALTTRCPSLSLRPFHIINKLDYLYVNAPTKEQADKIIQKLDDIATELADFRREAGKQ